jgi:hypothetical protein
LDVRKPTWGSDSFLLYAGGLVVLFAAISALGYLAGQSGSAAFAGWSLLVLVVLYGIALAYRRRDRWIAAGIFAFASVVAWAVFLGALWHWWGWLDNVVTGPSPFSGFSLARLSLELLVLAAVAHDIRLFRFPLIALIGVVVGWLFITDLISGGGNWSATVTFFVGLVYLVAGSGSTQPSAFWFHLASGALIGGALLYWWNGHDWTWWLVVLVALLYVAIARGTGRSSWAVLGALGLLAAAQHFADDWSSSGSSSGGFGSDVFSGPLTLPQTGNDWVPPLVYAFTGFLLVALGLAVSRRRTP